MHALLLPLIVLVLQAIDPAPPLGLDPAADLFLAGRSAYAAGNSDQATSLLRRAIEMDPGETEVRRLLAQVMTEQGHAVDALLVLDPELGPVPSSWSALQLGQTYVEAGNLAQAELAFQGALAHYPKFGRAKLALADLMLAQERLVEAESLLLPLHEREPEELLVTLAVSRLDEALGDLEEARRLLVHALESEDEASGEQLVSLRLQLAHLEQLRGDENAAWLAVEPLIGRAMEVDDLVRISRFASDAGFVVEAIGILGAVLLQVPTHAVALGDFASLLTQSEELEGALARRRLESAPDDPASLELAVAHELSYGRFDQALELIGRAPEAVRQDARIRLKTASALRQKGQVGQARVLLTALVGEAGGSAAEASYELGLLEFGQGEFAQAEIAFRSAAIGELIADAQFSRALCLNRLGNSADAAEALEVAVKERPEFREAWLQLGLLARYTLGDRERARAALTHYFALGGDDAELREWMGLDS